MGVGPLITFVRQKFYCDC